MIALANAVGFPGHASCQGVAGNSARPGGPSCWGCLPSCWGISCLHILLYFAKVYYILFLQITNYKIIYTDTFVICQWKGNRVRYGWCWMQLHELELTNIPLVSSFSIVTINSSTFIQEDLRFQMLTVTDQSSDGEQQPRSVTSSISEG